MQTPHKIASDLINDEMFEGYWWLPESPENKVAGIAYYDVQSGVTLKLFREFDRLKPCNLDSSGGTKIVPIILGENLCGKEITLINGEKIGKTISSKPSPSFFRCREFIQGYHSGSVVAVSDISIIRVELGFTNLTHWLGSKILNIGPGISESYLERISDAYCKDTFNLPDGLQIEFISHYTPTSFSHTHQKFEIKSYVTLYHAEGRTLKFYKEIIYRLQELLSFSMRAQVYPKEAKIFPQDDPLGTSVFHFNQEMKTDYVFPSRGDRKEAREMTGDKMLFDYSLIKPKAATFISNWLTAFNTYKTSVYLYFSVIFNTALYPETMFLSYIRAIEGILRVLQPKVVSKKMTEEDRINIDTLVKEIQQLRSYKNLRSDPRRKFDSKLDQIHEPSLEERLRSLVRQFTDEFCNDYLLQGTTCRAFTENIAKIRNFLAHQLISKPDDYENTDRFGWHIQRLEVILQLLLFKILGFEYSEVEPKIKKAKNYLQPYA